MTRSEKPAEVVIRECYRSIKNLTHTKTTEISTDPEAFLRDIEEFLCASPEEHILEFGNEIVNICDFFMQIFLDTSRVWSKGEYNNWMSGLMCELLDLASETNTLLTRTSKD